MSQQSSISQQSNNFTQIFTHRFEAVKMYDLRNGLLDMGRDIILHLCDMMGNLERNIRMLMGICQEQFLWKKHSFFKKSRGKNTYLNVMFEDDGWKQYSIKYELSGEKVLFLNSDWHTIFMKKAVLNGVYQWTVRIEYAKIGDSSFSLGVAPSFHVERWYDEQLGKFGGHKFGSCSFWFWKENGGFQSTLYGVEKKNIRKKETQVLNNSLVSAEIDVDAGKLYFFVNGNRVPHAVCNISYSATLGMSGILGGFISTSFRRLPSVSKSFGTCKFYPCIGNPSEDDSDSDDNDNSEYDPYDSECGDGYVYYGDNYFDD